MAVGTEVVAVRYENVVADTPISVPYPVYEALDIRVLYGKASLVATHNTDYTVELGDDFNTFTLTPKWPLIAKINDLIDVDPTEVNYITVRRVMDNKTDATAAAVRYTPFTAQEFDRTVMRFQQLQERLSRSISLGPRFVGTDETALTIDSVIPGRALTFGPDGRTIVPGVDITAETAAAALSAAKAKQSELLAAAAAEDAVAQGNVPIFASRDTAATYNLAAFTSIMVNRWDAASQHAPAFYVKVGSEPLHAAKFQSEDGSWFAMMERKPNILQFGAPCNNVDDDAAATQRAIDYAQTFALSSAGVPPVVVPAMNMRWASTVTWKTAPIICEGEPNTGARIFWDGAAGGTMLARWATNHPGTNSFNQLRGINFRAGNAIPATFIDLTPGDYAVDNNLFLDRVHLNRCSGDAIKIKRWINVHWGELRFDAIDGFAISMQPANNTTLSSFVIDKFTYDNAGGSGGLGIIHIDNTANSSNVGVVALRDARIEINAPLLGNKALCQITNGGSNGRTVDLVFQNVTVFSSAPGNAVVYNVQSPGQRMRATLMNVNFTSPGDWVLFGGSLNAGFQEAPPLAAMVGYLSVGANLNALSDLLLVSGDSTNTAVLATRRRSDANNRFELHPSGQIRMGGGSVATDVILERSAADTLRLGTGDKFVPQTSGQELGSNTNQWRVYHEVVATASLPSPGTAMNGAILIEDAGSGDRNLVIYAGGQRFRIDGGANF